VRRVDGAPCLNDYSAAKVKLGTHNVFWLTLWDSMCFPLSTFRSASIFILGELCGNQQSQRRALLCDDIARRRIICCMIGGDRLSRRLPLAKGALNRNLWRYFRQKLYPRLHYNYGTSSMTGSIGAVDGALSNNHHCNVQSPSLVSCTTQIGDVFTCPSHNSLAWRGSFETSLNRSKCWSFWFVCGRRKCSLCNRYYRIHYCQIGHHRNCTLRIP